MQITEFSEEKINLKFTLSDSTATERMSKSRRRFQYSTFIQQIINLSDCLTSERFNESVIISSSELSITRIFDNTEKLYKFINDVTILVVK